MPSSRRLQAIFNEIRNAQSVFKNKPSIVNKSIKKPDQVYECARVLERRKIELLIIQRVINYDIMKSGCPSSFNEYLRSCRQKMRMQYLKVVNNILIFNFLIKIAKKLSGSCLIMLYQN